MTLDEQRPEWETEEAQVYEELPPVKKKGRASLVILLCLLLIGAGAGLFYKDMTRNLRHGIYRCEGGRMLEMPVEPDADKTAQAAQGIEAVAQAHPEIEQYMMLIPCSAFSQQRFLPEGTVIRNQAADLAAVRASMPRSLHWVDLTQTFSAHEGEKLYYATDIHLTGWGSRYAARAALTEMEAEVPEGKDICYLLSNTFRGPLGRDDLLSRRILDGKTERVEIYVPEAEVPYYRVDAATGNWSGSLYDASAAAGSDPLKVFFGGERPLTEIYSAAVNGEILLVVGDSMADTIVPRFVSSFEKIIFLHPSQSSATIGKLIEKYNPTKILYIYGANSYMKDRALLHALGR